MISKKWSPLIISLAGMLTVLGLVVGAALPNALLPRIDRPEITLFTGWNGKGAQEIEQSLVAPMEKQLDGMPGLVSIQSNVSDGGASTRLEFQADTDMEQGYIELLSRINQVPGWPSQVSRPVIFNQAAGAGRTLATAMMYATTPKTEAQYIDAFRMYVEPALSKIPGVANLDVGNNPMDQRLDIEFDPAQLARYSLTITEVASMLGDMMDRSGDSLTLGSRDYGLHFKGQTPVEELEQLAVSVRGEHIVRLGELATFHTRLANDWSYASINGQRAFYFVLAPALKVNALEAIDQIKSAIDELNQGPLADLDMVVTLSRDDSKAIKQALLLVYGSLLMGILLASAVLYLFLRNWRVVALVFVSIPVCLALVMLAMKAGGYSLNVISLAGMALSVGLLLDAAIIVVDNILRIRRQGVDLALAVGRGAREVQGAIFSSTLSSIIIFIPVLMMRSSESQLFKDLAFTISSALVASILVALILLPTLARYFLGGSTRGESASIGQDVVDADRDISEDVWSHRLAWAARRRSWSVLLLVAGIPLALVASYWLMPNIDVLPDPKQRIVRAFIALDEPLTADAVAKTVARPIFARIDEQQQAGKAPSYDVYGMFCGDDGCLLYFYPSEDWDYASFKPWVQSSITHNLPGTRVFVGQGSLLRFAMPNSRNTQLDLKGDSLENLQLAGRGLLERLQKTFPDADIREDSPLYNQSARIEFSPKQDQLIYLGMSQAQLNRQLVALTDGLYLGRFFADGDTLPFYFKGQGADHLDALMQTQIMVTGHGLVPLTQLVDARMSLAPQSLQRINRQSSVSLSLSPPDGMPVGPFVEQVKAEVAGFLAGRADKPLFVSYRGSADRLNAFLMEFGQMFIVALGILFVLMCLTLKSWRLAAAVMLSMPLAIAGGMLNLQLLNLFTIQNLDVITMIGFIILLGLVINNAILLASQYEQGMNRGLAQYAAIVEAVKLRKRPIYMSTGTSIFGMLPLMLSPGDGAEIYRGLAAVIIGGMTLSALFSLSFMAALLSLPVFAREQQQAEMLAEAA